VAPVTAAAGLACQFTVTRLDSYGELVMNTAVEPTIALGKRFGLEPDAIFRLWKSALKDDDSLLDEAITAAYDRMTAVDPARAEEVISLIIRRQRGARLAFRNVLSRR
jgi:hypothetical protein